MPYFQYSSDGQVQRHAIVRNLTTIGSAPESDLRLQGADVAASHCTLIHEPGRYRLESTQRSTPFFVRGKKMRAYDVKHGDTIAVGGIELVFSAVDAAPEPKREEPAPHQAMELAHQAMGQLLQFSELLLKPENALDAILSELIDQVVAMTRANKGFLVLAASADGDYEVRVARNLERQPVDSPSELLSDNIIREVITSKKAQIISDAYGDERYQNSLSVINLKLSSVMCVPLMVRGELLGLIYVGNNDVIDLFTAEQLETLKVFAGQAALFIKNAKLLNELRTESQDLAERLEAVKFGQIIGTCPAMIEVYKKVEKVASTDITVLITGETGTGKELIAHETHNRSPRAKQPFVTVNCGAIPENLIESELFGHIKGAFTGAVSNQIGKFQAADGGTIFLDEIGELPLSMQVKLLRVLQERKVQRVGETRAIPIDIRIVAATNRDLRKEVQEGNFREDLYFRINVIHVQLPPLRTRGGDVLQLAQAFLARFASSFDKDVRGLSAEAAQRLLRHPWPGNVRELRNSMERAVALSAGRAILPADLPPAIREPRPAPAAGVSTLAEPTDYVTLAEMERRYVFEVLDAVGGNKTTAARVLGMDRKTLHRRLKRIERDDGAGESEDA